MTRDSRLAQLPLYARALATELPGFCDAEGRIFVGAKPVPDALAFAMGGATKQDRALLRTHVPLLLSIGYLVLDGDHVVVRTALPRRRGSGGDPEGIRRGSGGDARPKSAKRLNTVRAVPASVVPTAPKPAVGGHPEDIRPTSGVDAKAKVPESLNTDCEDRGEPRARITGASRTRVGSGSDPDSNPDPEKNLENRGRNDPPRAEPGAPSAKPTALPDGPPAAPPEAPTAKAVEPPTSVPPTSVPPTSVPTTAPTAPSQTPPGPVAPPVAPSPPVGLVLAPAPGDKPPAKAAKRAGPKPTPAEVRVFAAWVAAHAKGRTTVFDAKRIDAVRARLAEGFSVEDLCRAVDGCALDPFSMGENNRKTKFNDLALICRDAAHVEKFRDIALAADEPPSVEVVTARPFDPELYKQNVAFLAALRARYKGSPALGDVPTDLAVGE